VLSLAEEINTLRPNKKRKSVEEVPETIKKLRPSQEDKFECQKIAKEIWEEHPLDIKYMKMHPNIRKIVGKQYKDSTLHGWLSDVAPQQIKRGFRRSKDYIKKQLIICKKLGIKVPKK